MTTKKPNEVRDSVRNAYTRALHSSRTQTPGSCCSCGSTPVSVAARSAGYTDEEKSRFAGAAGSSFGCGNPLAFEGVSPGQTVLDLGSGAGLDLLLAAERVGPAGRVIGVDMTDAMIETARQNALRAGFTNVEVRRGTIEALPVEDGSVDWVISNCVINLSPEKGRVFREIARVLRPGGQFAISDIVAGEVPPAIRERAEVYSACIGGAIGEPEYREGLVAAGLADVEVVERLVYDEAQLRGMIGDDAGVEIAPMVGRVWSAKFRGRRPAQSM